MCASQCTAYKRDDNRIIGFNSIIPFHKTMTHNRRMLTQEVCQKRMHTMIISRLDKGNALLVHVPHVHSSVSITVSLRLWCARARDILISIFGWHFYFLLLLFFCNWDVTVGFCPSIYSIVFLWVVENQLYSLSLIVPLKIPQPVEEETYILVINWLLYTCPCDCTWTVIFHLRKRLTFSWGLYSIYN